MYRKLFIFCLVAVSSVRGGPVKNEDSTISQKPVTQVDNPGNLIFEEQILELLEALRKLMREGDPKNEVPPLEPLHLRKLHFDFYLQDTALKGLFRDTVVEHLSDFQIKNLTLTYSPGMELKVRASFHQLDLSGFYNLFGMLYGELPIDGYGLYRVHVENLTLSAEAYFRPKAGVLQVRDWNATFGLDHISVKYKNEKESDCDREFAEDFVLGVLHRFRTLYLPLLLHTLKVFFNDLIQRWSNREELTLEVFTNGSYNDILQLVFSVAPVAQ